MHSVLGEKISMPVEIREANACSAMFFVDVGAVEELLGDSGMAPVRFAGRGVCSLAFVRYVDGDLGPYHEFAFALLVRRPGVKGSVGAYIHWLPVNQSFTCAAGRGIWGFPKEIADIRITPGAGGQRCEVRLDDELVIAMQVRAGLPTPSNLGGASIAAYTNMDGVLRRTPWVMNPAGTRMRLGGTRIELGEHPISNQLRALGLPKRALFSSTISKLRMTFEDAQGVA